LVALDRLPVKGAAALTGYDRDSFHWKSDVDRNGCDTRNDILRRDLADVRFRAGTGGCLVESGTLVDPYSGQSLQMRRAADDPVDIDHVVSLGNAWVTGAFRWSEETRTALANDPLNLLAVDGSLNRQKGDSDSASWLPPRRSYRCAYVARQLAVKRKYALWLKPAEKAADVRILSRCPGQELPTEASVLPPLRDREAPTATPSAVAPTHGGSTYYASCDAVRAAGKAPLYRGQPGYEAPRLDRDGDGVACES
jgi:hypothetical protein